MALQPGTTLGPYEILSLIGAGGMGEVYRARDPRLNRDVAIKVLPADRAGDDDRRRRFVQEAHAASALNHPHIVTIHEIESAKGIDFIVMEYVRGKSLDELIPRHGMRLLELLRVAIPVADALAAAHARGIIHRDLKPANVMVGADGAVKVLDFGLAKLTEREDANEATLTHTAEAGLSVPGTIAGTAGYMSPEQATGAKVDARSDIFSFGAMLYEMVTGQGAFAGKSTAEVLSAVIHVQPTAPAVLVPSVPRELERLILRCLQKDRDRRSQHMLDVKIELREIQDDLDRTSRSETATPVSPRRRSTRAHLLALAARHRISVALAGILVAAGVVGGGWRLTSARRTLDSTLQREATVTQLTANPPELPVTSAQISPDGRYLAYADPTGIQVRVIASGDTQRLPDTRGVDVDGWSDDGTVIRGRSCEGLTCTGWNLSLVGAARHRSGATWPSSDITVPAPDGSRFLRIDPDGQELWIEFVNGAPSQRLVRITEQGDFLSSASWSRDATRVFFTRTEEPWFIESISTKGGRVSQVFKAADGQLVEQVGAQLRDGRLLAVVANMAHSAIAVLAVPVTATHDSTSESSRRLMDFRPLGSTGEFSVGQLSASSDGTRVGYLTTTSHTALYVARFDAHAKRLVDAPRRITIDERGNLLTDWTPDGRALLFESLAHGTTDIFIQSLTAQLAQPLVTGPGDQMLGRVTSDGQWVLFVDSSVGHGYGPVRIMRVPMSGGLPQQVYSSTTWACPRCSAHGQCALFEQHGDEFEISALDPVRGKGRQLATIPRLFNGEALLADGQHAAFIVHSALPTNRIRIVSLAGEPTRDIIVNKATMLGALDAAPDGSGLFSINLTATANELLFISLDGASKVLWTTTRTTEAVDAAIPSPDGTQLAMDVHTQQTNAWMLSDF